MKLSINFNYTHMTNKILALLYLLAYTLNAQVAITDITNTNLLGDKENNFGPPHYAEYGGHGIMFGDADGDGDPDMYITMNRYSPMADQLFINNGSGVLTEDAVNRGVDDFDLDNSPTQDYGSHGWVWADLDNDGDFDGWNGSYSENIPYRNKNNQPGYFEDFFTSSGIDSVIYFTRGVVAFDYDKDGDLDLFANNWYSDPPLQENEFYRNNGNMTFTRIDNGLTNSKGDQGVCAGDFDNDGDIDLIISVFEDVPQRCVEIWENVNGQFIQLPNHGGGLNLCERTDGATFWDMNNDGWLDVVSGHKIFLNNKNKTFSEVLNIPGLVFMRGIADLNNDGHWDMVTPGSDEPGITPKVYINNGDLTFNEISYSAGTIDDPRCVSFADIDGDGDVDFALAQKGAYNRLYRNDYSGSNRHLFVKLKTADNQIGAYGAKVYIYTPDGNTLLSYREAHSNHGYLAQDDPVMHFGCGVRDSVRVKVVFLNGHVVEINTATNQTVEIIDEFVLLKTKIYLEGPYNTADNTMSTALKTNNYVPTTSPYSQDPRTVASIPTGVVDWVLVELRSSAAGPAVVSRSAFLMSDGTIVDDNGASDVILQVQPGSYYIIIRHRNHLAVMSKDPVSLDNN